MTKRLLAECCAVDSGLSTFLLKLLAGLIPIFEFNSGLMGVSCLSSLLWSEASISCASDLFV